MDIQLFATDEELQDFPENKTDSTVLDVLDKTPNSNSINLTASHLPRPNTDLPKISSNLPDHKAKHRRNRRHRSKPKNRTGDWQAATSKYSIGDRQAVQARKPNVHHLPAQVANQLEFKQEIQWISKPIPAAYLSQLVDRPVDPPPPSEAVLPSQPTLSSPEIDPLLAHQPVLCPLVPHQPVVRQPDRQVPPLLSLLLRPDLNALARTLSPQALWYVHLSIQISQNLLN